MDRGRRERFVDGALGNALGTLIAAPLLYVGAVAAGLLRANPRPVFVAMLPLMLTAGWLAGRFLGRATRRVPLLTGLLLLVPVVVAFLAGVVTAPRLADAAGALSAETGEALRLGQVEVATAKLRASSLRLTWSGIAVVVALSCEVYAVATLLTATVLRSRGRAAVGRKRERAELVVLLVGGLALAVTTSGLVWVALTVPIAAPTP